MKTAIKIILLLGVVLYLAYAIIGMSHSDKDYVCQGMEIAIEDSTSRTFVNREYIMDILAEAKISPEGNKISTINLRSIEKTVAKDAYIDSVLCYFTAEHNLCVCVIPRTPVLHVMSDEGKDYYMDAKEYTMPAIVFNIDLPLATGRISEDFARKRLLKIAEFLHQNKQWDDDIEQILVKDANHIYLIPKTGDFLVSLGEGKQIVAEMQRLDIFLREGLPKAGWNKYSIVDVSYDKQVVCTKKK